MTSYEILKQEWFSIRNQEDAIRSKKEAAKFKIKKEKKFKEIKKTFIAYKYNKLFAEVQKMLDPNS